MIAYHRIAARLYGQPLLLLPSTAQTVEGVIRARIREGGIVAGSREAANVERGAESYEVFEATRAPGSAVEVHGARSSRFVGSTPLDASGRPLPFRRTQEGVAIITIVGELVNRGAWIGASSGLVSYEGIAHQLRAAASDAATKSILLDIESPGGEAVGAFECAAAVRAAATIKPVVAVVNGMAASAGYAIASGASRIVTTPTGLSGSIGVVMMHLDHSKMLADIGVEPTFVFAGAHKVDGNPYEPLPDSVRAEFQREIDEFYGLFLNCVATGRGARLTEAKARATEARVLMGQATVTAGLADAVMTFDEALDEAAHFGRPANSPHRSGVRPMSDTSRPEASPPASPIVVEARRSREASLGQQAARQAGQVSLSDNVEAFSAGTEASVVAMARRQREATLARHSRLTGRR